MPNLFSLRSEMMETLRASSMSTHREPAWEARRTAYFSAHSRVLARDSLGKAAVMNSVRASMNFCFWGRLSSSSSAEALDFGLETREWVSQFSQ